MELLLADTTVRIAVQTEKNCGGIVVAS